jgi:hypothetical protein
MKNKMFLLANRRTPPIQELMQKFKDSIRRKFQTIHGIFVQVHITEMLENCILL